MIYHLTNMYFNTGHAWHLSCVAFDGSYWDGFVGRGMKFRMNVSYHQNYSVESLFVLSILKTLNRCWFRISPPPPTVVYRGNLHISYRISSTGKEQTLYISFLVMDTLYDSEIEWVKFMYIMKPLRRNLGPCGAPSENRYLTPLAVDQTRQMGKGVYSLNWVAVTVVNHPHSHSQVG